MSPGCELFVNDVGAIFVPETNELSERRGKECRFCLNLQLIYRQETSYKLVSTTFEVCKEK
jgi:hypothetical protein